MAKNKRLEEKKHAVQNRDKRRFISSLSSRRRASKSVSLSLESNQMRVPASRKTIFKEATEIDPIIGRIADSSFMFEKRTGFDRLYSL